MQLDHTPLAFPAVPLWEQHVAWDRMESVDQPEVALTWNRLNMSNLQ
jgi:hypothetical protein